MLEEGPSLLGQLLSPVLLGADLAAGQADRATDVQALVDDEGLGDQHDLAGVPPGPEGDHDQGQVLGDRFQSLAEATVGALHQ